MRFLEKGGQFLRSFHPTAIVHNTPKIGSRTAICPYAISSDAWKSGCFVLLDYDVFTEHNGSSREYSSQAVYAQLSCYAVVVADVFLGMHAAACPYSRGGAGSMVNAKSCVLFGVPKRMLNYGALGFPDPLLTMLDRTQFLR